MLKRIAQFGLLPVLFFSIPYILNAQLIPLHSDYINQINSLLSGSDSVRYTATKPLFYQRQFFSKVDTNMFLLNIWRKGEYKNLKDRLLNGHLIEVHKDDVNFFVDPIISFTVGKSADQSKYTYLSSRGATLQGMVGEKVQFATTFIENQARFPYWIDSFIRKNGRVVPGQGPGRNFNGGGFDFSRSDAYISYTPSSRFDVVLGYGKNFIGDGYRSLLLSDNAFSYPYLRLHAKFWRINYTALYNQYTNPKVRIRGTYQRKFSTIHYLSVDLTKRLQVGVFENIMWQASDSFSIRGFDLQYLNPVLFLRPVEFSEGSADNAMLGFTLKYQLSPSTFLYNQIMLDDLNLQKSLKYKTQHLNNKYGIQLGLWTKDLFHYKGLNYRFEYNTVRPFAYGHRKVDQNYTHYNQALAHPLGANFHEVINNFNYSKKRWSAELHSVFALIGEDYDGKLYGNNLWGGEANVPELGIKTLDGLRTTFGYNQLTIGWTVNPSWNTKVQLQVGNRFRKNSKLSQSESFFNIGIVTNFANYYYDF